MGYSHPEDRNRRYPHKRIGQVRMGCSQDSNKGFLVTPLRERSKAINYYNYPLYKRPESMNQPGSDNTFVFSPAINGQYVIELYAGDYVMIEETFTDVLLEYDVFVQDINTCFRGEEVLALKSAVHKVKPLFGFVGLTDLQALCL